MPPKNSRNVMTNNIIKCFCVSACKQKHIFSMYSNDPSNEPSPQIRICLNSKQIIIWYSNGLAVQNPVFLS